MSFQEKNGWNNNEMAEQPKMATIEKVTTSRNGFELSCELHNLPVSFVNALRRLLLSSIPTVVITDVEIIENTTQLPHEMLKHRFEMLPINILPENIVKFRDTTIELHVPADKAQKETRVITTEQFKTNSEHSKIIMKDRDLDTPLIFLRIRPGEGVHIRGKLAVSTYGTSQVCTVGTGWHVDKESELYKVNRTKWVEDKKDVREFDNSAYQRYYSRDEKTGLPNWFDVHIESIGIMKSKDILKEALRLLRKNVEEYVKEALENIQHENKVYKIKLDRGGHTIGNLMQSIIYENKNVEFVSYDVLHPLRPAMEIQFYSEKSGESILKNAKEVIEEYCEKVESGL